MSRYAVYVIPRAWEEMRDLPGNVRQRVKRSVEALATDPRPPTSAKLNVPDFEHELRRIRMDKWRIVYWSLKRIALSMCWLCENAPHMITVI